MPATGSSAPAAELSIRSAASPSSSAPAASLSATPCCARFGIVSLQVQRQTGRRRGAKPLTSMSYFSSGPRLAALVGGGEKTALMIESGPHVGRCDVEPFSLDLADMSPVHSFVERCSGHRRAG